MYRYVIHIIVSYSGKSASATFSLLNPIRDSVSVGGGGVASAVVAVILMTSNKQL